MERTVDGDRSDGSSVLFEGNLVLGEVGFCPSDELVRRGGTTLPAERGGVDPRVDWGGSYEGRTQVKE